MLAYVFVLVLFTTPIWSEPPVCGPEDDFLAPHEDCTKYYACYQGNIEEMSCPDGLHFNPQELYCDFPDQAGCEGSTGPPTDEPTEEPTDPTEEPTEEPTEDPTEEPTEEPTEGPTDPPTTEEPGDCTDDSLQPFPGDCTKYYVCDNGSLVEQECPDGLHFNPIDLICDFPEVAGCE